MERAHGDKGAAAFEARRQALGHNRVSRGQEALGRLVFGGPLTIAQVPDRIADRQDLGGPAFTIEPHEGRVDVVVDLRTTRVQREKGRGDLGSDGRDRFELLLGSLERNDGDAGVLGLLREKLVHLRQIERLAARLAGRRRRQDDEEPQFQVARELDRIAERPDSRRDRRAICGRRVGEGVMVAIERARDQGGADLGLLNGVERAAEFGDDDLRLRDRLGRPPRQRKRVVVRRVDRPEEVRGRQGPLVDSPEEAVGVDKVVRSLRQRLGETGNMPQVASGAGRRRGERRRGEEEAGERGDEPARPFCRLATACGERI